MITVVTKPMLLKQSAVVEADGLKSFKFQRNLEKKMLNPKVKVIFLSAETGGGKTRGFVLPALKYGKNLIIVAPTNALIFDIALNVQKLIDKLRNGGLNIQHQVRTITRYSLYVYKNKRDIPKGPQGQAFLEILRGGNPENTDKEPIVIVTNPDSLAVALQMLYYQSEKILGEVVQNFSWIVFDEFHAYSPKQIPAIMHLIAMIDLYGQNTEHKVVFSSATPTKRFEGALRKLLNLSEKQIHQEIVTPVSEEKNSYQILQKTRFFISPANLFWDRMALRDYVQKELPLIINHIPLDKTHLKNKNEHRVCIISNSVFEASEIADHLRVNIKNAKERIEEIRGFMSSRAKGRGQKPIVVGTSSIEMGVNFPISMLFTEGSEGTPLIQKIGRLGRTPSDEIAEAHLLVPPKIYEELLGLNGKEVERSYFREKIIQAYPKFEDFWSYIRILGLYENESLIEQLAEYNAKQFPKNWRRSGSRQKEWFRKNLLPKLAMAYEIDNYEEHLTKLRTLFQKKQFDEKWIKRTLKSTRGETIPVACAIYDRADERRGYFPFKTYDIRLILSRGDIISVDSWEIYKSKSRKIPAWYVKVLNQWKSKSPNEWEEHQQEINVGNVEIFFEIDGLKEQARSVEYMDESKNSFLRSREFYILPVSLSSQNMDLSLNYTVSNVLKDIQISTFIIQIGNRQGLLKLKENLPPLFELSALWQRKYSFQVAFGISALYLWSRELEQSGIFKNDS